MRTLLNQKPSRRGSNPLPAARRIYKFMLLGEFALLSAGGCYPPLREQCLNKNPDFSNLFYDLFKGFINDGGEDNGNKPFENGERHVENEQRFRYRIR